jgi:hypothetical protein
VSTYASTLKYRAWGGLKQFTDGSNRTSNIGYNARLQVNHFDISGGVANQNYDYYNDGRLKFIHNTPDNNFERSYSYDHAGRVASAASGGVARGDATVTQTPYNELFGYDAFSNPNYRYTGAWSNVVLYDYPTYTNNRHQDWEYDADGRNTNLEGRQYSYDAAGQMTGMSGNMFISGGSVITSTMVEDYDGAGAKAKEVSYDGTTATTYYLMSTALGGAIVEEMDGTGQKKVGYVYAGGQILAQQSGNVVTWKHNSPTGASQYNTQLSPNSWSHTEFDAVGADITYPQPPPPDDFGEGDFEQGHFGGIMSSRFAELLSPSAGCTIDGMKGDCGLGMSMVNSGAASFGPARTVAGIYNRSGQYVGLAVYSGQAAATGLAIFGQGSLGFLPAGTSFTQAPGGAALSFASWFTSLPEYANQFNNSSAGFGSMQGLNSGLLSVKSAQMMSIFFAAAAIPQNPAEPQSGQKTTGTQKETKECADMRAKLLGDPFIHAALDDVWNRSQASPQHPKQEEGGLLGTTGGEGLNVDSHFTRQGKLTAALEGFPLWANRKIRASRGTATFEFWYHTHPHDYLEVIPGEGTQGMPDFPSPNDLDVSKNLGLLGILISKKQIVVFDKDGFIRCHFDR